MTGLKPQLKRLKKDLFKFCKYFYLNLKFINTVVVKNDATKEVLIWVTLMKSQKDYLI